MAGIYPNSDFIICKGVPLEPNYEHTFYQLGKTGQYNMINAYAKYTLNNQSYQRVNKEIIRVGITADNLYDCNYVMFRNTSYGSKWFYAFITSAEYVNDNCSDITYEIDVMQTWYFDYTLGHCFVEREHSLTDNFGESLYQEGLECGDLIIRGQTGKYYDPLNANSPEYYAVIYYIPNEKYFIPKVFTSGTTLTPADVSLLSLYSCYNFTLMPTFSIATPIQCGSSSASTFTLSSIRHVIAQLIEISATIISVQMVPTEIANAYGLLSGDNNTNSGEQRLAPINKTFNEGTSFPYIHKSGSYTPHNRKLFQYPYSQLVLSNNAGDIKEYKWELFDTQPAQNTQTAYFKIQTTAVPEPTAHMYPYNYRNGTSMELGSFITDFPRLSWSEDSFQQWWNTNKNSWTLGLASNVINGGLNAGLSIARNTYATGKVAEKAEQIGNYKLAQARRKAESGARFSTSFTAEPYFDTAANAKIYGAAVSGASALGAITGVAQSIAQFSDAKAVPDSMKGNPNVNASLLVEGRMGFTLYDTCITGEMAEIIDNYFDMFGYAVKKVKIPNIQTATAVGLRPYWNYIKTGVCIIHSDYMNAKDQKTIEDIYNKGITFWSRPQDVGNYNLNNAPRGG